MVNNSDAKGNFQTLLELHEESDKREQGSHSCWNPDRGRRYEVSGGREFVGEYSADGDDDGCDLVDIAGNKKNFLGSFS